MKVLVHRKDRGTQRGYAILNENQEMIDWAENLILENAEFWVNQKLRNHFLQHSRQRNLHAYVLGNLVESNTRISLRRKDMQEVKYIPYRPTFYVVENDKPIYFADILYFQPTGILIPKASEQS